MKHRIRINGEVKELECQFGSGFLDKNGREIFEGDLVKIIYDDDTCAALPVVFYKGSLFLEDERFDLVDADYGCELEIIGRAKTYD